MREVRLRWFRLVLKMEHPGRAKKGRSRRKCMDAVREGLQVVGVTEEDAED